MQSEKRIKSICHNIAHHAISGLSFLNPHLYDVSINDNSNFIVLDLLAINPCPDKYLSNQYLSNAAGTLKTKFEEMLKSENYSIDSFEKATLRFEFPLEDSNCTNCEAQFITKRGLKIIYYLDYTGKTIRSSISKIKHL